MKQLNLFDELEKQLNAEAKEQASISTEVKRGRPVGSTVKKTYKAEELIQELESKGGTPDKSFQVEMEPSYSSATQKSSKYAEEEIEEVFRVLKDLARLLKKFTES